MNIKPCYRIAPEIDETSREPCSYCGKPRGMHRENNEELRRELCGKIEELSKYSEDNFLKIMAVNVSALLNIAILLILYNIDQITTASMKSMMIGSILLLLSTLITNHSNEIRILRIIPQLRILTIIFSFVLIAFYSIIVIKI